MYNLYKFILVSIYLTVVVSLMSPFLAHDNNIFFCLTYIFSFIGLFISVIHSICLYIEDYIFKVKKISNSNYFVALKNNQVIILYNELILIEVIARMNITKNTTSEDIIKFVNQYKKTDNDNCIIEEFKNYKF